MKNFIIIALIIITVFSCGKSSRPEKPQNLIPKDKMSLVLYDLFIINSAKGVNRKLLETNGVHPERYILEKHNIDSAQFANSNNYYAYDIEGYKGIIEKVKSKIEKEKAGYQAILDKEDSLKKRAKDSIRAARKANPNTFKKAKKAKKTDSIKNNTTVKIKVDSINKEN